MKKCNFFDENKMSFYIDNRMKKNEKERFEKHLFNCDYCFSIYHNLKDEIKKIEKVQEAEIPQYLIFQVIEKLKLRKAEIPSFTKIVLKLYEKGMELTEILNVKKLIPVTLEPMRSKENINFLKSVSFENQVNGIKYKVTIDFFSKNSVKIKLDFSEENEKFKNSVITIISEEGKIISSFSKEKTFENLPKGNYTVKLNDIKISQIVLK